MTDQSQLNPYSAPLSATDLSDARHSDWYLASACRYLHGIGCAVIVYCFAVIPFWLHDIITSAAPHMSMVVGIPLVVTALFAFSVAMIKTAGQLPTEFPRRYRRARWLGILAGAIGFPVLSIPAFLSVWRLSTYRNLNEFEVGVHACTNEQGDRTLAP